MPDIYACPCCLSMQTHSCALPSGHSARQCGDCRLAWATQEKGEKDLYEAAYTEKDDGFVWTEFLKTHQLLKQGQPSRNHWYEDYFYRHIVPFGRKRLLEVGCSIGRFLYGCRQAGWNINGLDISEKAVRLASDLLPEGQFREGTMEQVEIEAGSFEVVAAWEVLEHVNDPFVFAARASELLTNGGILAISTPDWDNWAIRRHPMENYWPPYHLWFFTEASMRALLKRAGFEVFCVKRNPIPWSETCWPLWKRLLLLPWLIFIGKVLRQGGGRLVVYARKQESPE